jgi:transmembrane sensor
MNGERFPSDHADRDSRAGEAALRWARQQGLGAQIAASARARRRRRRQLRQALAGAGVCLGLVAAVNIWPPAAVAPPPVPTTRPLVVSAPLRQVLPDGSVVEFKAGAKIHVDYGPVVRRVRLEAGEAHFAVAKNKEVPFVVSAGAIEVRALGTEFAVELRPQGVDVLVTEGRVAVERPAPILAPAPLALLEAGQSVAVELGAATPPVSIRVTEEERNSRLAWRVPRIELSRTPLAEVVACFNRHGAVRLQLADPSLGTLQLSGVLRPDSAQALIHILKSDFGLQDDRAEDGTIVLRRP